MTKLYTILYHLIEKLDGEKLVYLHLLPYKIAEYIKLFILKHLRG
jgi:hypothetical protein